MELPNLGAPRLMLRADVDVGWQLSAPGGAPWAPFFGVSVFGEYPFNGFVLPHVAIQSGVELGL